MPWDHLCRHCFRKRYWFIEFCSQIFKKKALSEGQHRIQVAGPVPTLTCTDLALCQGKAVSTVSYHGFLSFLFTHGQMDLICPLYSWASCKTDFGQWLTSQKKVTFPSHCKGGHLGDIVEEASASLGTSPYQIYSMSEKKTSVVPTSEILGLLVIEG